MRWLPDGSMQTGTAPAPGTTIKRTIGQLKYFELYRLPYMYLYIVSVLPALLQQTQASQTRPASLTHFVIPTYITCITPTLHSTTTNHQYHLDHLYPLFACPSSPTSPFTSPTPSFPSSPPPCPSSPPRTENDIDKRSRSGKLK